MSSLPFIARSRTASLAVALAAVAISLGGCGHTNSGGPTAFAPPDDYRLRHPIAVHEANQSIVVFVGQARGGLTSAQRTDVMGLAQEWQREGTGPISIDVPIDTPNARAAADSAREIESLFAASGLPPKSVVVKQYRPESPQHMAAIRLSYSRISATAGPCGLWPEDLGPSIKNSGYFDNRPYHNFGCAYQRNMAAMADNPADLVQPRPESPPYQARRAIAFDKYRKGTTTATSYPESDKAKLSDTGK